MTKAPDCPRCDGGQTRKIADSPVAGKFEVYRCEECNFVWRSSEDLTGIDKRVPYWREHAVRYQYEQFT